MEFNHKAGSRITKDKYLELIQNYRKDNPKGTKSNYFGREVFEELLRDPEVAGITIVHAQEEDGAMTPVLRPTSKDNRMGPVFFDDSLPCPPFCPDDDKEVEE